jgi:hypothetical protein
MQLKTFLLVPFLIVPSLMADEGMWTYNRLPLEQLKADHDFEPSADLLTRLQKGSVRLNNGGSGSFVSPNGLVMTNHHVASDCIRKVSSEKKDYVADGFYAATRARELKCPDLELNVLMEIETVTDQVNRNVKDDMDDAAKREAQQAEIARIQKDCRDSTLMRCDVVSLYAGGIFDLYKYKRYTDIRLVFAPEFQAAFFGGDPDNFTYPRYCLDVSFLRVYDNGRPISSPAVLPWDTTGADEQEFVIVSGHPGSTQRLRTEAQLQYDRDRRMPFMLDFLTRIGTALEAYGAGGGDAARLSRDELFRINNSIKAYTGMLAGLRNRELFAAKSTEEKTLRTAVAADAEQQAKYGDAWQKIAAAQSVKNDIYEEYRLLESLGLYSRYITFARHLTRLSAELGKPDGERLEEYQSAGLESLYQQLYSTAPVYPDVEVVKLAESLEFLRDRLSPNDPTVKRLLGNRTPEQVAREVITGTKLGDPEFRKQLGANDAASAKDSDDPMMVFYRLANGRAREIRKRYEDEVDAVEQANGTRIAQARFAAMGANVYPDATFTLRLAFGMVKAYLSDERKRVTPFTTIGGLFDKFTGEDPYELPKRFTTARRRLAGDTPYNLVSTNDITGGNSGSPLLDREGRVVGLIFDGNIQSLSNDFQYSETQARAVSVDVRGMLEILRDAYGARTLVSELTAAGR